MRRRQTAQFTTPFVFTNPFRVGAGPRPVSVAASEIGDGFMCVEFQLGIGVVTSFGAMKHDFGGRYVTLPEDPKTLIAELKAQALQRGATLEAIMLLGQLTPLSKQETLTMTQAKLQKPAGPDKETLAKASKAAPKSGKAAEAPKRRGNPEALAKAREQKGPAPDRTYKAVKGKENTAREGTWTATMLEIILDNTSTDDAKAALKKNREFGDRKLDFTWAEKQGYIKF